MPPLLSPSSSSKFSALRSRTNSILDTITGAIPEPPPNGTFKDRSLTCRTCGNRFRDVLELDRHFNLLPHHSDYADSHNFDSFTRPKGTRRRSSRAERDPNRKVNPDHDPSSGGSASPSYSPSEQPQQIGFSESNAFYSPQQTASSSSPFRQDKGQDVESSKPTLFRKLSALASTPLVINDQVTDYSAGAEENSKFDSKPSRFKGKGIARVGTFPRLRRDDSNGFLQALHSDDDDNNEPARVSNNGPRSPTTPTSASLRRSRRGHLVSTSDSSSSASSPNHRLERSSSKNEMGYFMSRETSDTGSGSFAMAASDRSFRTAESSDEKTTPKQKKSTAALPTPEMEKASLARSYGFPKDEKRSLNRRSSSSSSAASSTRAKSEASTSTTSQVHRSLAAAAATRGPRPVGGGRRRLLTSSSTQAQTHRPAYTRPRHASEGDVLLSGIASMSLETSDDHQNDEHHDAPPSYQELHGDRDPFEDVDTTPWSTSPNRKSHREAASLPTSPIGGDTSGHRTSPWAISSASTSPSRQRRSTNPSQRMQTFTGAFGINESMALFNGANAASSASPGVRPVLFPVKFSAWDKDADDSDKGLSKERGEDDEDDLYWSPRQQRQGSSSGTNGNTDVSQDSKSSSKAGTSRTWTYSTSSVSSPPALEPSRSASPSPCTPQTPSGFGFFISPHPATPSAGDAGFSLPVLPPPPQASQVASTRMFAPTYSSSTAAANDVAPPPSYRKSRHASRSKSESNPQSTRCPTCFLKFSSLAKVLDHLDHSDCGAVDFESGIM